VYAAINVACPKLLQRIEGFDKIAASLVNQSKLVTALQSKLVTALVTDGISRPSGSANNDN
jgi:hypothetical protein